MAHHRYRITVEPLADDTSSDAAASALHFEVANHDDILHVVERLRTRADLPPDTAAALGVGLKLFGEVLLEHRTHPLFRELYPHFGEFMRTLKGKGGGAG
ncbi:DUF3861 family protein [Rhodocyclus tenuis]|uniref:DUF3861 domain-containing protein n=1 Tax=Rhodocyclus gracilis TaxID=2929842 RepID=UPI001298D4A7|nr:DUF3861 domain-containing protein [Rhodocyclus gracilis]MRD71793.1 DUF3861 family protein [Rhodocyclus gracilis]